MGRLGWLAELMVAHDNAASQELCFGRPKVGFEPGADIRCELQSQLASVDSGTSRGQHHHKAVSFVFEGWKTCFAHAVSALAKKGSL